MRRCKQHILGNCPFTFGLIVTDSTLFTLADSNYCLEHGTEYTTDLSLLSCNIVQLTMVQCSRSTHIICFIPTILLPRQNLVPTLAALQLNHWQLGQRFWCLQRRWGAGYRGLVNSRFSKATPHNTWDLRMYYITVLIVSVWVYTIFSSYIADDVDFIHGNLPVGFLLAETQSPAFLSVAGVTLNT